MAKAPLRFQKPDAEISVQELGIGTSDWLANGEFADLSPQTLATRRFLLTKLVWFLNEQGMSSCGPREIRAFFNYLKHAHEGPEGRWGNPQLRNPIRPATRLTYFNILKQFFAFLVSDGVVEASPCAALPTPEARQDQIVPFSEQQVNALLDAARRSKNRRRDEALVLFLLDTGCRASEVCSLRMRDVDLGSRRCNVLGKGNKSRSVFLGKKVLRALWTYLKEEPREDDEPLFTASRGQGTGEPLTRSGLLQLIERLGKAAKIEAVRCSPHTFRHTFAVTFLRNGGNTFALQHLLGHTNLKMTNRYVAMAQADLEVQHRHCSPADRLKRA